MPIASSAIAAVIVMVVMPIQMASTAIIRIQGPEKVTRNIPIQDIPLPKLFHCYCNLPECLTKNNTCITRQGCFSELQAIMPEVLIYGNCTSDNTSTQCFTTTTPTVTSQSPVSEHDTDETTKIVLSNHNMDGSYGCLEFIPTNKTYNEILRNVDYNYSEFPRLQQSEFNSTNDVIRAYHCCQEDMCNDRLKVAATAKAVQNAVLKTFTNSNNPNQTAQEELLTNSELPQWSPILTVPDNISTTNNLLHLLIPNITADIPSNYPDSLLKPIALTAEKDTLDNDDLIVTNKTKIIETTILSEAKITTKTPYEIVDNLLQSKDNLTNMETNDKDITSKDNSANVTHILIPNVDYNQTHLPIISILIAKINNSDNNVSSMVNEFPNINNTKSYANTSINISFDAFNSSSPSIAQLLLINYTEISYNITNMINNNTANITASETQTTQEDLPTNLVFIHHEDLIKTENIKDTTLIPQLFSSIPENASITDTPIDALNNASVSTEQIMSTTDAMSNNNITKLITKNTTEAIMSESPTKQEELQTHLVFEQAESSLKHDTINSSTNILEHLLMTASLGHDAKINTKNTNEDQEIIESVPLPIPAALKSQDDELITGNLNIKNTSTTVDTLISETDITTKTPVETVPFSLPSVEQYFTTLSNTSDNIINSIENSTTERITTSSINANATYNSSINVTAISPNLYNNTILQSNVTFSAYTDNMTVASMYVTTSDNINYVITNATNNSVMLDKKPIFSNTTGYSITTTNITDATTATYVNTSNVIDNSTFNANMTDNHTLIDDLSTQTTIIVANGTSDISDKFKTVHVIHRRQDDYANGLQQQPQQQNSTQSTLTKPAEGYTKDHLDVAPDEFPRDKEQDDSSDHHIERTTEVEPHQLRAALIEFCDWLIGFTGLLAMFGIIVVSFLVVAAIKILRKAEVFSTSVGLCRVPGQPCPCMTNIGLLDVNRIHSRINTMTPNNGPINPIFPAPTNGENINNGYNYNDSMGNTTFLYTKIPVPTLTPELPRH